MKFWGIISKFGEVTGGKTGGRAFLPPSLIRFFLELWTLLDNKKDSNKRGIAVVPKFICWIGCFCMHSK